jgi:hypothetical protein
MKILILISFFIGILCADIVKNTPLFATVINVASDDVLNVRQSANYRSKKIGDLPNEAIIKVYKCKKIGRSKWCKIGHMALIDYDNYGYDAPDGWVNAKFLSFDNRGYVLVNKKGGCYYSLSCGGSYCKVLVGSKIKNIARYRLLGVSRFNAGDGEVCNPNMLPQRLKEANNGAKDVAKRVARLITNKDINTLKRLIHPTKGLLLTNNVTFAKINKHFTRATFERFYNSKQKLYWGETEGRGDKVYLSLKSYLQKLTRAKNITKIINKDAKSFYFPDAKNTVAYELKWIDKNSKTKDYDWLGLVVVMQKYRGKYYIVGLLHNRWTI